MPNHPPTDNAHSAVAKGPPNRSSPPLTPAPAPRTPFDRLRRKLGRKLRATICDYGLVEQGDRVLVGLSGGKDSYTLLDLLHASRALAPIAYEVIAVHVDQGQPGYDGQRLAAWLEASGLPYEIVRQDTYSVVERVTKPGEIFCAACSRLRRGVLYSAAERLGCNKIALGHHRDDSLETFLLNLFYAGKLQAMPARYTTDDGRFDVIRPLVECAEADIAEHARHAGYPILPCGLCSNQADSRRDAMTALLDELEQTAPDVRNVMLAALRHVRPSHLLDRKVAAAWAARGGTKPDIASP